MQKKRASKAANNLWYLDIPYQAWKDAPILQRFSKSKTTRFSYDGMEIFNQFRGI